MKCAIRKFFTNYRIRTHIKATSLYLGHSTTSITLDMYVNTSLRKEDTEII
jgi:hypothetical protein